MFLESSALAEAKPKPTLRASSLPPILRRYLLWSVLLTIAAFGTKSFCMRVLHLPEAYLFTVAPQSYFNIDFRCFYPRFLDFHHSTFFVNDAAHEIKFPYPAPAALVFAFFYRLPAPPITFYAVNGAFVLLAGGRFISALRRHGITENAAALFVGVSLFCSWPLFVVYWTGNIEIVNGILVGFGLYLFVRGKSWASATLIGIAAAIKVFPFVFLALFLGRRQYKQMAYMIGLAGAIDVLALHLISGSIATSYAGIAAGLEFLRVVYILPYTPASGLDHSLFAVWKTYLHYFANFYPDIPRMTRRLKAYTALMAVIDATLYFTRIRKMPLVNQILTLTILAILTTPLSLDYTFMHLYVGWGMLVLIAVDSWREGREVPGLRIAFACFMLLFSCLSELMYHACIIGGQVKAVVLVALLIITLRYSFPMPGSNTAAAAAA